MIFLNVSSYIFSLDIRFYSNYIIFIVKMLWNGSFWWSSKPRNLHNTSACVEASVPHDCHENGWKRCGQPSSSCSQSSLPSSFTCKLNAAGNFILKDRAATTDVPWIFPVCAAFWRLAVGRKKTSSFSALFLQVMGFAIFLRLVLIHAVQEITGGPWQAVGFSERFMRNNSNNIPNHWPLNNGWILCG